MSLISDIWAIFPEIFNQQDQEKYNDSFDKQDFGFEQKL